jgi:sulfur-oxidizing protein SoxZ
MVDKPRIKLPREAKKGEVVEIKTLLAHPMESGLRKNEAGALVPRKIINRFTCEFNGALAFACDLEPAISANPYFQFTVRVEQSGTFRFTWIDDDGSAITADESITVS